MGTGWLGQRGSLGDGPSKCSLTSYVHGVGIVVAAAQRVGEVVRILVVSDHGPGTEALVHDHAATDGERASLIRGIFSRT